MKITAKIGARPWGFTLIELLTVIAIVAVLATLLSASLASAKKKSRRAASTSNLRQIAFAVQLYTDDHKERPYSFAAQVGQQYLSARVLACPEDKSPGANWAGATAMTGRFGPGTAPLIPNGEVFLLQAELPHSYFKSFDWAEPLWSQVEKQPLGGVAACQLHGIGRPDWSAPAIDAFQGNVLRALRDGSVIARQVFASGSFAAGAPMTDFTASGPEFSFFVDPVE